MNPATLLPRAGEPCGPPLLWRKLRVGSSAHLHGILVRRGLLAERPLTSVKEETLEFDLVETMGGKPRLAPDNPFLTDAQKQRLDSAEP